LSFICTFCLRITLCNFCLVNFLFKVFLIWFFVLISIDPITVFLDVRWSIKKLYFLTGIFFYSWTNTIFDIFTLTYCNINKILLRHTLTNFLSSISEWDISRFQNFKLYAFNITFIRLHSPKGIEAFIYTFLTVKITIVFISLYVIIFIFMLFSYFIVLFSYFILCRIYS
jgi:hypothetical protein